MNESIKKCSNCEKDIEAVKFILHEPYCLRLVTRCDRCNEPVDKEELEDHHNENHKLADCGDCGKKLEKRLISSHKKKCLNKTSICTYCELSVPRSELHDHEYICGSKTETCHQCGALIPIMEYDLHIEYTCKKNGNDKSTNTKNFFDENKTFSDNQSKKQNFDDYAKNLEKLRAESEKSLENKNNISQTINNIERNKYSNNLNITDRKIDDILNGVNEKFGNSKKDLKNTNNFKGNDKNTKNSSTSINNNINNKLKKEEKISFSYKNISNNDANKDYDDDVLLAILEMSKNDK